MTPALKTVDLSNNAIVVNVKFSTFGNRRKSDVEVKSNANREFLNVTKRLLPLHSEINQINAHIADTRRWIDRTCSGDTPLGEGSRMLSLALYHDFTVGIEERRKQMMEMVDQLCANLETYKRDARKELGDQYDEADYPTATALRKEFGIDVNTWALKTPSALKKIDPKAYEKEYQRNARMLQQAAEEGIVAIRSGIAKLVDHFVGKLAGDEDGKPKIFRDSTITNLVEALDLLPKRNLWGDTDLLQLTERMKKLLKGVDPDELRKDGDFRASMEKKFTALQTQLNKLVTEKPKRAVSFED